MVVGENAHCSGGHGCSGVRRSRRTTTQHQTLDQEAERTRIIALLSDNDADIWHSENFQRDLIALIKGDNE